jgi:uncharacterized protein (DUF1778 family)
LKAARLYANVIHMENTSQTTSVLSVRVNSSERALLEEAAGQARTSLSDFVRRKALESAETDILNQTLITIPAKDWEVFEAWLLKPASANPGLEALAKRKPIWEK